MNVLYCHESHANTELNILLKNWYNQENFVPWQAAVNSKFNV